jgi:hypothetical protein
MNDRLLTADISLLLLDDDFEASLPDVAHRLAQEFGLPWAAIRLDPRGTVARGRALVLNDGRRAIGTLLVPRRLSAEMLQRVEERAVPALEGLLAVAIKRAEKTRRVAITD